MRAAASTPIVCRATQTERVQGVIAREKGAPVSLETVLVSTPERGEVRVRGFVSEKIGLDGVEDA